MSAAFARSILLALLAWALALPAFGQESTLARIKRGGEIVLGYIEGAAPFSDSDASGQPQGYSVDLCRAVARGIGEQLGIPGLKARWQKLTVQNRIDAVRAGRVDVECSTTSWTLTRQGLVDFSLITFVDGANVLSLAKAGATRLESFAGKRIAVLSGTTTEKVLREALARRKVQAEVVTLASRAEGMRLLEQAEVEGLASDRTTLIGAAALLPDRGRFRLMDEDLSVEPYALMLPRGDQEFRVAVNRVLAGLYRSGGIRPIYDRWLGPLGAPSVLLNAAYFIQSISE
jgi:ABC-type amino acid transport substrate-binding protein